MPSSEVRYGRHVIKTMASPNGWRARAFRGDRAVSAIQSAATAEAAIEAVKGELDVLVAEARAQRGPDGFPTAGEVAAALPGLSLSKAQEAMLRAHLRAPGHILTAGQLAQAAGYKDFSAANLQYGYLGRALSEELDWRPAQVRQGAPVWTYTLAENADDGSSSSAADETSHFRWRLRPQVVEALKASGWS